jgi:hypothetical protein
MLTDTQRLELRGELFRGNPMPLLARARLQRDPQYLEICEFILAELRKFHGLPDGRHCRFIATYSQRFGTTILDSPWHEGGRDTLQAEGNGIMHPDPLPPEEPARLRPKNFLGVEFKPKHETR